MMRSNQNDELMSAVKPQRTRIPSLISGCWLALAGLLYLPLNASAAAPVRATVTFEAGASELQIEQFLADWRTLDVDAVMRLPFINGAVLSLPDGIDPADFSDDPLVVNVSSDYAGDLSAVRTAGEGASGEGASKSVVKELSGVTSSHWQSHRPWGVLSLYGQYFDPELDMDLFSLFSYPGILTKAVLGSSKIKIAVFDTGIDYAHPQLNDRVRGGVDLINLQPGIPMDYNGHGTHVAGTLVAWDYGLSKFSQLYAVKILQNDGSGDVTTLLMALQWAIDNDMDIVNMSIGFRNDNPIVRAAIESAHEAGLVMVAAVGNRSNWEDDGASGEGASGEGASGEGASGEGASGEGASGEGASGEGASGEGASGEGASGEGASTSSCYVYTSGEGASGEGASGEGASGEGASGEGASGEGASGEGASGEGASGEGASSAGCDSKAPYTVMYPAAYPQVVAVAAIDPYGDLAQFSNTGPETDVYAPGVNVTSAYLNGSYGLSNGTSMATPHVSGTIALMLSLAKQEGIALSQDDIAAILRRATSDIGGIDLEAAVNEVNALKPPTVSRYSGYSRYSWWW